jgi:hypothetical protein
MANVHQMSFDLLSRALNALDGEAEGLRDGEGVASEMFGPGIDERALIKELWGVSDSSGVNEFIRIQAERLGMAYGGHHPPYAVLLHGLVVGFRAGALSEIERSLDD